MSVALNTVVKLAEAVSGLIPTAPAAARPDPTLDPIAVLSDLRLPDEVLEMVAPVLQGLGFSLEAITLSDTLGFNDTRQIHRCRLNASVDFFLAHIPSWILERNTKNDRAAVDFLRHSFNQGGRVYIVSEGVESLKIAFIGTFEAWRQQSQITAHLIPWNLLKELKETITAGQALTPAQRTTYLKIVFKLDGGPGPGAPPAANAALNDSERKELATILAKQASGHALGTKGYYSALLKNSNLPQGWVDARIAALGGVPEADATALVQWAVDTGTNTKDGRQSHTVLAELIENLMMDVGLEQQKVLKQWALNKPLILTQAARDAFQQKYPLA
jgi:hypothetical protein